MTEGAPSRRPHRERHPLDALSLLAGVLFVGLGALVLTVEAASVDIDPRWIVAALLVGLGLAGVLGSLSRPRTRRGDEPSNDEERSTET